MVKTQGFSLLELSVALLIASAMAIISMKAVAFWSEQDMKKEAGGHAAVVKEAARAYAGKYAAILTNQQSVAQACKRTVPIAAGGAGETAYFRKVPRLVPDQSVNVDPFRQTGAAATSLSACDDVQKSQTVPPVADMSKQCGEGRCAFFNDAVAELVDAGVLDAGFERNNPYSNDRYWMEIRVVGVGTDARIEILVSTFLNAIEKSSGPAAAQAAVNLTDDRDLGVVRIAGQQVSGLPFDDSPGPGMPPVTPGQVYAFGKPTAAGNGWALPMSNWTSILPPNNVLGQLVARVFTPAADPYLHTDGSNKMGNNFDVGGNLIKNLKKVPLDSPCDGTDATSAASKAYAGHYATVEASNPDPNKATEMLGTGFLLVCGYDQVKQGYVWKKATTGITSVEDAMAGMMDGYETGTDWVCWTHPTAPSKYNNVAKMKFAMYQGKVLAFMQTNVNTWTNVTVSPGGYDLNVDYSAVNPSYATNGYGYNWIILYEPSTSAFYCDQGAYGVNGNPDIFIIGDWYFGPDGIKFQANGQMNVWGGTDANGTMGGIPVTGNVSVSGSACTTVIDAMGGSTTSCVPSGGSVALTGQTTSLAGNRTLSKAPVKQTSIWAFQRKTKMNLSSCAAYGQSCSG